MQPPFLDWAHGVLMGPYSYISFSFSLFLSVSVYVSVSVSVSLSLCLSVSLSLSLSLSLFPCLSLCLWAPAPREIQHHRPHSLEVSSREQNVAHVASHPTVARTEISHSSDLILSTKAQWEFSNLRANVSVDWKTKCDTSMNTKRVGKHT